MPANIKISLDCRDINIATTGTHTYLSELIAAFNKQNSNEVSFVFIKPFVCVMPGNNAFAKLIRHFQFFFYKQIPCELYYYKGDLMFALGAICFNLFFIKRKTVLVAMGANRRSLCY